MKISNQLLAVLVLITFLLIALPSILVSYDQKSILPFVGYLLIIGGFFVRMYFYHRFTKKYESQVPQKNIVDDSLKCTSQHTMGMSFRKKIGTIWVFVNIPFFFYGGSILDEVGRGFVDSIGYVQTELIALLISILFTFSAFHLYKNDTVNPNMKALVAFSALISIYFFLAIAGHLLSGNEIMFTNAFS